MKKRFKYLLLLLTVTVNTMFAQDGKVLNVPYVYQEYLCCWCWAAGCDMIAQYYGNEVELCEIVEYARSRNPQRFGHCNCCNTPTPDSCINSNLISGTGGIPDILTHWGINNSLMSNYYYTLAEIKSEINGNRPFMFQWCSGRGCHTMVGRGYNGSDIYVINPGDGYHIYDYNWVVYSDQNYPVWKYTHKINTSPVCGDAILYYSSPITTDMTISGTNAIIIESTISNNSDVIVRSPTEIYLNPNFEITTGSTLDLDIDPSLDCNSNN